MVDFRALNGNAKATLIQTFDGKGMLAAPGWSMRFASLEEAKKFAHQSEIEINVDHIHGTQEKKDGRSLRDLEPTPV